MPLRVDRFSLASVGSLSKSLVLVTWENSQNAIVTSGPRTARTVIRAYSRPNRRAEQV